MSEFWQGFLLACALWPIVALVFVGIIAAGLVWLVGDELDRPQYPPHRGMHNY